MPRRGDNIHKRKDGRWEGRYKKGITEKGTVKYGSVYGKSYKEVKEKLSLMVIENEHIKKNKRQEIYFKEVLFMWMMHNKIRYKGATINKYQNIIDTHIIPDLGQIEVSSLSSTIINSYLNTKLEAGRVDKQGGLSPSYVRSIMIIINAALKFAEKEQLCEPLKTPICKPTVMKKELMLLTVQEQKRLETYLQIDPDQTKTGILICLHTGLRIGEVCALSWDDIDLHNNVIKIRHTIARVKNDDISSDISTKLIIDTPKTKASIRDIPISSHLRPILLKAKTNKCSNYVLSNSKDFLSPRTLEYRYHRILEKCEIPSVNFHSLRHTFATRCIEAGVDVKSLSEILGHANVGVTLNIYVHSSMEMKRKQLEKLDVFPA